MAAWTMPDYLDAICERLRERQFIIDNKIDIRSSPVGEDELEKEVILFFDITGDEEDATIGDPSQSRTKEEEYILDGVVQVIAPGSGETIGAAARRRCALIFDELAQEVKTNNHMGLNSEGVQRIRWAAVTRKEMFQRLGDGARVARVEFEITVKTRV